MNREKQYASYKSLAPEGKKSDIYQCMTTQDLQHRKKLIVENAIVCVYLFANWCEPCKNIAPEFNELAKQYNNPGRCLLTKEDLDLDLTRDCQVTGIPCFIFYINGILLKKPDGIDPFTIVGGNMIEVRRILDNLLTEKIR
jgi:thiol-disulfide isomerase/thioredoxin